MKNLKLKSILIVLSIALLFSCNKKDENELIGKWKLVEVLIDPGDGSGVFTEVTSNKTIKFKVDNVITSNGSLCDASTESSEASSGTYSLTDSTYISDDCTDYTFHYTVEGETLIVTYQCIEACQAKYKKN